MALPPAFLDELRARTPLAPLVARRVKLARSGRNWKGCCPFHTEKSPSFYVYDDGYHCFGCGAHGDAISFVMQSHGASFPEAIAQLAAEAGLEVPKPSPQAAEAERHRIDLQGVLELAARSFARRLFAPDGRRALDYLRGRGLTEETIGRFGLGWAGEGRGSLLAELKDQGVDPALAEAAGLLRPAEDGRIAGEMFFNRVMFPIRDRTGRVISFGGRILGDGQPKYVNGPETAVFSKRRTLFGLDFAREAARKGADVVVAEGYMDVIALHQAGFAGAVAPLGTALTEEQLAELWRLSPAPVLCFDGDSAGARAAARAATLVLPHLTPAQGIRLATLPAGEDPDSLVRARGPDGFAAVLRAARPLSETLYGVLAEGATDSPEQRAALRARLIAAAEAIRDRGLAIEYRRVLLDRFYARKPTGARPSRPPVRSFPTPTARFHERARNLVALVLSHPQILAKIDGDFGQLDLPDPLRAVRDATLQWTEHADVLDSASLKNHLASAGLARDVEDVFVRKALPLSSAVKADSHLEAVEETWWALQKHLLADRLKAQISHANDAAASDFSEQNVLRLIALREAELSSLEDGPATAFGE